MAVQEGMDIALVLEHKLAIRGNEEIVRSLLEIEDISVDIKCPKKGAPLSFAMEQGHTEVVRLLLNAGADPNTQDDLKRTLLHWAGSSDPTKESRSITGDSSIIEFGPEVPLLLSGGNLF